MTNINNNLSEIFDMEIVNEEPSDLEVVLPIDETKSPIENDYEVTRKNLLSLLATGQNALDHAFTLARQSEHPRAFEVVGNLMKQVADINQQLMELHAQKQKLDAPSAGSNNKVTNNLISVGTTADLLKLVSNMKMENY